MTDTTDRCFDLVFNNAVVFDGVDVCNGTMSVGISDGVIARISSGQLTGVRTVDASGHWLSPGLIDSHVHMFDPINCVDEPSMARYLDETLPKYLRALLESGVTTIKSVGDPVPELIEARRRLAGGIYTGPNLLMTGTGISAAGGHPGLTIYGSNEWYRRRAVGEVETPQDARARVGEMADLGADAIKVLYQGGCPCHGGTDYLWHGVVPIVRLKRTALEAAIDESHRRGLKVTVHTFEEDRAIEVLEAGADGLEHGVVGQDFADDRLLELLLRNDASYIPTLWIYSTPASYRNLARVRDAGARIVLGTDSFSPEIRIEGIDAGYYGSNSIVEAERMAEAGLAPIEVMRAATSAAAIHLGRTDLGIVADGKRADLILLAGDPTANLGALKNPIMVISNGRVVHERGSAKSSS
ncbi:amidohydrolase family protein [Polymorphobacter sp. PAMC 29334]|uniref:amidohydrolase family protein n=1 Tax=Polymorphobacter sp. PAMC 29334 TaxID=2862331 RepID=UPI001C746F42|nr:amidohydrolase family protein [Polymorphobacter sp. PAMC 29334]QYE36328.1 amidohydrolase family protein [Polymorphobacter sp. PAMC 29334]